MQIIAIRHKTSVWVDPGVLIKRRDVIPATCSSPLQLYSSLIQPDNDLKRMNMHGCPVRDRCLNRESITRAKYTVQ